VCEPKSAFEAIAIIIVGIFAGVGLTTASVGVSAAIYLLRHGWWPWEERYATRARTTE
jgi:hypothetical protein